MYYNIVREKIIYISGSYPTLVLATVMGHLRHTDAKTMFKIIRGQLLPEKMQFENTISLIRFLNF
jgi:hypothetical protein